MIYKVKAKILKNEKVKENYFKLILIAPKISQIAKPGQFLDIRINNSFEPLLRRPFSIHRVKGLNIEILYEVVGCGTEILSKKTPGEYLDVIGPLGKGFDYQMADGRWQMAVLVAGGMGVAPLTFLAEKLAELPSPCLAGRQAISHLPSIVLLGAKTKDEIICEREFKELGCQVKIATDDGSRSFKGEVTELLKSILQSPISNLQSPIIYACGPKPMLREIALLSERYNIPAQVSLEEIIACGIGACLGCVVKTKEGYKRVCKEGPIFNVEDIVF